MSGGSFEYLYFRLEEQPFDSTTSLRDMAEWLKENGEEKAAKELAELADYIDSVRLAVSRKLTPSILNVVRAAEWWCSCDTNQDDFEKVYAEHSKK